MKKYIISVFLIFLLSKNVVFSQPINHSIYKPENVIEFDVGSLKLNMQYIEANNETEDDMLCLDLGQFNIIRTVLENNVKYCDEKIEIIIEKNKELLIQSEKDCVNRTNDLINETFKLKQDIVIVKKELEKSKENFKYLLIGSGLLLTGLTVSLIFN